jgi:hypothetical protein
MPLARYARLAIACALLVACGGDASAPKTTLTGTWAGQLEGNTFQLTLTQAGTDVTGTGSVRAGATTFPLTAAGTVSNSTSFSLTLSSSGFSPLNFAGTFGRATMTGTVNGSGFTNAAVTLTKQ